MEQLLSVRSSGSDRYGRWASSGIGSPRLAIYTAAQLICDTLKPTYITRIAIAFVAKYIKS